MSVVLGIDAGGSKTVAVIAHESGTVLSRWQGGGLDPQHVPDWEALLGDIVATLCQGQRPASVVIGLPMHGEIAALNERQRRAANDLFSCPHLVLNDVEVAYDGAFTGENGALVLAGTGSMAWAKADGESFRIGGWGDIFGDEGSAYWIGREALSIVSRSLDGRQDAGDFAPALLAACGCKAGELIDWTYSRPNLRAGIAELARDVDRLADNGDPTAILLLRLAADTLAAHVQAARRRLACPSLGWSYAGSVFGSRTVIDHLSTLLGQPVVPKLPPVGGAVWRAAALAGLAPDERFVAAVSASLNTYKRESI